ncbi:glucose 1-dehydrogenase [Pusillimonas sp.]|uniref:SDR family NAD(P)-dependent oxidoreductase n=1 Tax=Pusillimonas sp. TaxID=3040095 RepID=UPI0029A59078|nr:glucose 1-dehydrogenase [Pusillimonas sp.]MDX3895114.1 glucose 1-dehydrogenase [Pusillimonas sp.]
MTSEGRLQGRVAIVTGAAQGIGAQYAQALAAEGASVVVSDVLDAEPVAERINEAGGQALAVKCDVTDAGAVSAMVGEAVARFGRLDILVNNAALFGTVSRKRFEDIASDEWDRMMAVNVRGAFECVKAAVPAMRDRKYGKIVNIASGTVFKGQTMLLHYVTSKGAIVAMSRSLARELGDDGIRVNTLAPGLVMSENVRNNWSAEKVRGTVDTRAIKREALPEDMCGTLVYLCSPESDFVTGQVLVVDGGAVMH